MNKVILLGFIGRDPEVRYGGANNTCIAKYSLAVKRPYAKDGETDTDWFNIVAFGRNGEFTEKYFKKGMKVVVEGRIQTGSYEKDGVKHYTTDIIAESQEFAESKKASEENNNSAPQTQNNASDDFMNIPDDMAEDLPWN